MTGTKRTTKPRKFTVNAVAARSASKRAEIQTKRRNKLRQIGRDTISRKRITV